MRRVLYILVCLGMASMVSAQVTYQSPENNAEFISIDRFSDENDLVFTVDDSWIAEVDVLFGPDNDPNLTSKPEYKIVDGMAVSSGNEYTVTLETLASDLENSTDYYWKVIAYEPNGVSDPNLNPVWIFTTIQIGPYLGPVTPEINGVLAGNDAEFTVFSSKADTWQWYKAGDPNVMLSDGVKYSGTTTDTLIIHDAQYADEGDYYCIGTETGVGSIESEAPGTLRINELKYHFEFNSADVVGDITPDSIAGIEAQLLGGASVVTGPNTIVGDYLLLENPGTNAEDTEYVQILDTSVFDYPEITISAWYNMSTIDNKSGIWDCGQGDPNYWVFSPSHDGAARWEFRLDNTQRTVAEAYDPNENRWYFATVTLKDGVAKLYIDGKYEDTYEDEEDPVHNPLDLEKTYALIGYRVDGIAGTSRPKFNGLIDELKVYNYAMSTVDVAQAYMEIKTEIEYVCNDEIYDLGNYDYDGDCQVGLSDFAEIISRWLDDFQIL